eukprot:CAMPEP_0171675276 /NCGR_PEP_ID=MMETSP0990-20121206/53722_2 /TAXON_ID=483369 /ORGANISM="non described non described, Strain CCMP2098" /LENGTH=47 /DNA_ID= /DNA_START= /DNA_END= /DNA_ORIENTATION=
MYTKYALALILDQKGPVALACFAKKWSKASEMHTAQIPSSKGYASAS